MTTSLVIILACGYAIRRINQAYGSAYGELVYVAIGPAALGGFALAVLSQQ